MTTNHKKERLSITKEKLVYEVAKSIKVYLKELEVRTQGNLNVSYTDLASRRAGLPSMSALKTCILQNLFTSRERLSSQKSGTRLIFPPVSGDVPHVLPIRSYL